MESVEKPPIESLTTIGSRPYLLLLAAGSRLHDLGLAAADDAVGELIDEPDALLQQRLRPDVQELLHAPQRVDEPQRHDDVGGVEGLREAVLGEVRRQGTDLHPEPDLADRVQRHPHVQFLIWSISSSVRNSVKQMFR
jgi:hypothetical protein